MTTKTRTCSSAAKATSRRNPNPVEFRIGGSQFEANGYLFEVPLAHDFTTDELDADDLLDEDTDRKRHSDTTDAIAIIGALLPKTGRPHPGKPIIDACAEHDVENAPCNAQRNDCGSFKHGRKRSRPTSHLSHLSHQQMAKNPPRASRCDTYDSDDS